MIDKLIPPPSLDAYSLGEAEFHLRLLPCRVILHRVEHLLAVVLRACAGDQPVSAINAKR
jgi:hypothetical protein